MDAVYALILEHDADPGTLDTRLDEPLRYELDEAESRRLALRREARENQGALAALRGLPVPR